jgi:hypothetical protein
LVEAATIAAIGVGGTVISRLNQPTQLATSQLWLIAGCAISVAVGVVARCGVSIRLVQIAAAVPWMVVRLGVVAAAQRWDLDHHMWTAASLDVSFGSAFILATGLFIAAVAYVSAWLVGVPDHRSS